MVAFSMFSGDSCIIVSTVSSIYHMTMLNLVNSSQMLLILPLWVGDQVCHLLFNQLLHLLIQC